jgi:uncharacterized protein YheU (UPF0270 family)
MLIPHTLLLAVTLQAVIEEFVSRDGTDHSSIERRIDTSTLTGSASEAEGSIHFCGEHISLEFQGFMDVRQNRCAGGCRSDCRTERARWEIAISVIDHRASAHTCLLAEA